MPCESSFHRYVYRRWENLTAGVTYHFQTRNLRNVFLFQSEPADSVMYVVDQGNTIVASNDDYNGLASEILYTPQQTGQYRIIIRAYSTARPGYCDLYRGVNGAPPVLVESDVLFFGVTHVKQWNAGDVIQTSGAGGDPYLLVITGNKLYWDDDSGAGLNSRFVAPSAGGGLVVLGSYARSTEGDCQLCIDPAGQALVAAEASDDPSSAEFVEALMAAKPDLEHVEPAGRDERVAQLQKAILPMAAAGNGAAPELAELKNLLVNRIP